MVRLVVPNPYPPVSFLTMDTIDLQVKRAGQN